MFQAHATFQQMVCSAAGQIMTEAVGDLATKDGIISLLIRTGYSSVQVCFSL